MFEELNTLEKEKFNDLIVVLYEGVYKGHSNIEPYPNAVDTIRDKVSINSFCNIMETLEKDGYTQLLRQSTRVLSDKGIKYAENELGLK